MTVMTEPREHAAERVSRAYGIPLAPGRLAEWMRIRALSPQELSDKITELDLMPPRHTEKPAAKHRAVSAEDDPAYCAECGAPVTTGLTADGLIKIINGSRNPKPATLRALCAVLDCTPAQLQPGSDSPDARTETRRYVSDRNQAMRDFADAIGRTDLYRRPDNRIRYTAKLKSWYAAYQADPEHWKPPADEAEPALLAS